MATLMTGNRDDIDELLNRSVTGDKDAMRQLLETHRIRLKRMVCVRLDRRMLGRIDESDVVQEAMPEISRRLPGYAKKRPMSLYLWMRQIAMQKQKIAKNAKRKRLARNPESPKLRPPAGMSGSVRNERRQAQPAQLCWVSSGSLLL